MVSSEEKYLKYKTKYITLKEQEGQGYVCPGWTYFYCFEDNYTGDATKLEDVDSTNLITLDKFKNLVSYRAYELSTNGTISVLTLSYSSLLIGVDKEQAAAKKLYTGMFQPNLISKGLSNRINTVNTDTITNTSLNSIDIAGDLDIIFYMNKTKNQSVKYNMDIPRTAKFNNVRVNKIVIFYDKIINNIYKVEYTNETTEKDFITPTNIVLANNELKKITTSRKKLSEILKVPQDLNKK